MKRSKTKTGEAAGDSLVYSRIRRVIVRLVIWLFRLRVHHAQREPDDGNYLLCCNHISAMDPVVLGVALGKHQTHFMAKKELFRVPLVAAFLRSINAYPVDRTGDVSAIRTTVALIEHGDCVGVFPQGTRCPGRPPRASADRVKGGVGLLCEKTRVRVLPVCLRARKDRLRLFGGCEVIVGQPLSYEQLIDGDAERWQSMSHHQKYEHISRRIFDEICKLYEEKLPYDEKG